VASSEEHGRTQRAAVVFNPIKVDAAKLKTAVTAQAHAAGWAKTLWYETTENDAGQLLTAKALGKGVDIVAAAGGDGTVRAVAEALRGTKTALGLLPSGTGNLLARNLDVAITVEENISTIFTGRDRTIDLGLVEITRTDGRSSIHAFAVIAGIGIDAQMMAKTKPGLKKAVGWLAYIDGGVRALPEIRPFKMRLRIDGSQWRSTSAHTIMVGNCGNLQGGILLMPDAKPDDGILDFMVLRPRGPFGWLKVWNTIAWKNGVLRKSVTGRKIIDLTKDVKDVIYRQGTDLRLTLDSPQEIQLDGDEFGQVTGIHSWVDAGTLTVRVPI